MVPKKIVVEDFDNIYNKSEFYFGLKPCEELVDLVESGEVPNGTALDIGAGEGRDSLYLSMKGFDVVAIDKSRMGLKKLFCESRKRGLEIQTIVCDACQFLFPPNKFELIVATTFFNHLDPKSQTIVSNKIKESLVVGGFVFVEVFTVQDPGYARNKRQVSECHALIDNYYPIGKLLNDFRDLELRYYAEKIEYDGYHGPPHYHGAATLIARKNLHSDLSSL